MARAGRRGAGAHRVTAILPRGRDGVGISCAAGIHAFNGNGEITGAAWIEESGGFDMPILISNTHAIGPCHRGVIDWIVQNRPAVAGQWLLPVVAETWDGYLNDINGSHVSTEHAVRAIDSAAGGPIEEGSVGGGAGMNAMISRAAPAPRRASWTTDTATTRWACFCRRISVRARELTIAGIPLGRELTAEHPMEDFFAGRAAGAGSCIAVVATDAPLLPAMQGLGAAGVARSCAHRHHRLAFLRRYFSLPFRRPIPGPWTAAFRMARLRCKAIAISSSSMGTHGRFPCRVVQATEEAVLNALVANAEMIGRDGNRSPASLMRGSLRRLSERAPVDPECGSDCRRNPIFGRFALPKPAP